jgi:AcrR family transcriptional regulator
MLVFSQKGLQAAVIDDVIAQAGMARGSFYNYFRTNEELLLAVAAEISNELLLAIDPVVQQREDPAERVACGTRLVLHAAVRYPLLSAFLSRMPLPTANSSLIGIGFLARDVNAGIASNRFPGISQRVALDLVIGSLFSAARSLAAERLDDGYPEAIVKAMLRGLGLQEKDAERIIAQPLPDLLLQDASILKSAGDTGNGEA